jgi:hypothetical protein
LRLARRRTGTPTSRKLRLVGEAFDGLGQIAELIDAGDIGAAVGQLRMKQPPKFGDTGWGIQPGHIELGAGLLSSRR